MRKHLLIGQSRRGTAVSLGPLAPDALSGLAYWWRSDDLVLSDTDPVSTWTDRVAGVPFTQSSTARPIYKTNIFPTGKPAVRFDGTDDYLAAATGVDLSPYTAITFMLITASVSATAAAYVICEYGENSNNNPAGQVTLSRNTTLTATLTSKSGAAGVIADQTTDTNAVQRILVSTAPRVITGTFDRSVTIEQATLWINGIWGGGHTGNSHGRTNNNNSGATFATAQGLYLGARHASGVPTAFTPMDVAELAIWGRKLTSRELMRLHMGFDDKYDLFS